MSSDERDGGQKPVPIRGEVVGALTTYADDVKERCYTIWSTKAARNNRATARYYEAEADEGTPTPTYNTIRAWAQRDGWEQRRRDDFARNHGERLYDLQLDTLAIMERNVDVMADAQSGAFDDNPAAGIVRLRAGENATKIVERAILPLMPKPLEPEQIDDGLTREEREAGVMSRIARGTKGKSA